jgi:hypothetical protein
MVSQQLVTAKSPSDRADHKDCPAKEICNAVLEYAVAQDDYLQQINDADRIDDKTVFISKRA